VEGLAATLQKIPFFAGLPRGELARVAGRLEPRHYSPGQTVFQQGDDGDGLYLVQSGAVEVSLHKDGGQPQTLAVLGPHECFGEMSLLTGQKRSATVRALVQSAILKLPRESWDDLLREHPSISYYFCQVLSRRLGETNWEISKGRGALDRVLEEFFAAQAPPVQDLLLRTASLTVLDPAVIASALSIADPREVLGLLATIHPALIRSTPDGRYVCLEVLQDFLRARQARALTPARREELCHRFAAAFSARGQWVSAIEQWIQAGAWDEVLREVTARREALHGSVPAAEILRWLGVIQPHLPDAAGDLTRLRADALVRLDRVDEAIGCYEAFLARGGTPAEAAEDLGGYYEELAGLYQRQGREEDALAALRQGFAALAGTRRDWDAVQAMEPALALSRAGPSAQAFRWTRQVFQALQGVDVRARVRAFPGYSRWLVLGLGLAVGAALWRVPPSTALDRNAIGLLASLTAAVVVWAFNVFDEYIVALMLLFTWLLAGIVPPAMALSGFSSSSWFFFLGALGIGAAITKSGLLYRAALQVLRCLPPNNTLYRLVLVASGLVVSPVMPNIMGRLAIMAPVSQALAEAMGFRPRSNGSAGIVLAAYVGFSQAGFMFLTGATGSLFAWNLLPEAARGDFGWARWAAAALPAGLILLGGLVAAIQLRFPLRAEERKGISPEMLRTQLEVLGPLTAREWISVGVLAAALAGWATKPWHGVAEAWVTLGAFLLFLTTGVLDKTGLKSNIDWGFLLFFGVVSSLAVMVPHLKVDRWMLERAAPILTRVAFHPLPFLLTALLLAYTLRLFLNKFPAIILLTFALLPWGQKLGIHPGVIIVTILMAVDCWFLPYQDTNYQITYYGTHEKAFTHAQARTLMVAKLAASLAAVAASVPYWRLLGLIR
jgi:anion transporter